jgi:hypothetical protein
MVDSITLATEVTSPTLEETAQKMGIDPASVDSTATEQTAPPPVESKPERPANVPEKFWNAETGEVNTEALLKSYSELEKAKSKPKEETQTPEATEEKTEEQSTEEQATEDQTVEEVVENAGLDFNELSNKFWENDALDDSDYEALEKSGIPRALVDDYIAGARAQIELAQTQAFAEVGGQQAYSDMITWASKNLTEAEIALYDNAVNSPDKEVRHGAIRGLKARYSDSVGFEPTNTLEGNTRGTSIHGYESRAEMQEDMRNPKYKTDPAFRAKVERRIALSSAF